MRRLLGTVVVAVLMASVGAVIFAQQQAGNGRSDRACLNALVDSYLAAVVAHDPSRVSLAPEAKFVALRLKVQKGRIVEMEHLIARNLGDWIHNSP
jgi:hypothetical protein